MGKNHIRRHIIAYVWEEFLSKATDTLCTPKHLNGELQLNSSSGGRNGGGGRGGGAHLVEHWTRDPKTRGSNTCQEHKKNVVTVFPPPESLWWLVVGVPNPPVYTRTHKNDDVRMLKIL